MKSQKTVLIGLSGGVDSSVAALLLKKQGYKVIAGFIKSFSETKNPVTGKCRWREELKSAKKISAILNIPLYILNFEKQYKSKVINPMFQSYSKNLTPNPDILCNKKIKFPLLWKSAKKLKADYIATGHYARIKKTKKHFQLFQGKDKTKDQSYFLSELTQKNLSHALFPIGTLTKSQVRDIAKKNNFPNYSKQGTRGICFIGKINFKSFLKKKIKEKKGKILNPNNQEIGTHPGTMYYTIGERVGPRINLNIKIHLKGKWYIAQKKNNNLIIAPKNHKLLKKQKIKLIKFHKINPKEKLPKTNLKARIRNLGQLIQGKLIKQNNSYYFIFSKPQEQVAQGQQLVIYKNQQLLASGEIRHT